MRLKVATVAVAIIAITATVGVSAYTTGSIDRSANVNVVNDDAGLIALTAGTSSGLVYQNDSGALAIDFTRGNADGVNTEAKFTLGGTSDPVNQSAFNITNQGGESHDLTISYTGASDGGVAGDNIQFQIYDGSGTEQATVSEETTSATLNGVASGTTYYVVIVVDTHGLDTSADLSGTLTVSA